MVAVESSPAERVAVTESMNRNLNRVSVWCDLWAMKLNASKTKTIIVTRLCKVYPQLTPFTLDGTVLKESTDFVLLGETFDAKMTFKKHLRSVFSAAALRIRIMRKSWQESPEIFWELCPAGLGVLLSHVVLYCRFTS